MKPGSWPKCHMDGTVTGPYGAPVLIKNSRTEARQSISLNIHVFQTLTKVDELYFTH